MCVCSFVNFFYYCVHQIRLCMCQKLCPSIQSLCYIDMLRVINSLQGHVRQAAVDTLNAWLEQTGLACFVEGELFSTALATDNPYLKADVRICYMFDSSYMYYEFYAEH